MILERLKNLQKFNFDDWYNVFLGLEKRQQTLAVAGFLLLFLVLLWLPSQFLSSRIAGIEGKYQDYLNEAKQLHQVLNEYAVLQSALNQSRTRMGGEDDLSGLVYGQAEQFGIPKKKVNIKSVKLPPGELFEQEGKEIEIKSVPYDQLMRLLAGIQSHPDKPIVIKKLILKIDRKNRQLVSEAEFAISTIKARKP